MLSEAVLDSEVLLTKHKLRRNDQPSEVGLSRLSGTMLEEKNIEHERMQFENEETVAIATKGLIEETPNFCISMLP